MKTGPITYLLYCTVLHCELSLHRLVQVAKMCHTKSVLVPFCSWATRPNDKKNKKKDKTTKIYILYECVCVCFHVHMLELYECKFHLEESKGIQSRIAVVVCVYGNKNVHWTEEKKLHCLIRLILLCFACLWHSFSLTFSPSPSFTLFVVLILPRLSISFRRSKTKNPTQSHRRAEWRGTYMDGICEHSESLWNRFDEVWVSEWMSESSVRALSQVLVQLQSCGTVAIVM